MKKTLAILLTAIMLLGMIPMSFATEGMDNFQKTQTYTAGQFGDVAASAWYAAGVQTAYELGLMKGNSEVSFNPAGNLTVAEALAIACRMHSIYADNGKEFTQGSPWYQVYVDYAVANGIVKAGQLDPKAQISREQMAYVMCGAIPSSDLNAINNVEAVPDVQQSSTFGGFVYRLYNAGVLTGSDKYGTFKPTTAIQRSEVATIVTRMADKSQRKTFTLEKAPAVTEVQLAGKTQITVGETTTWTAKALPAEAQTTIKWTAGNPGVATVDANGNIKGIKAGQCNITATASNGVKKTVLLTVGEIAVTGITLSGKTQITVGNDTTWTATVEPSNATNNKLTWTSGNPSVATVNQIGFIKGLKAGQCNITVSAPNGVKKTVMMNVIEAPVPSELNGKITGRLKVPHVGAGNTKAGLDIVNLSDYSLYLATYGITVNGYPFYTGGSEKSIKIPSGYEWDGYVYSSVLGRSGEFYGTGKSYYIDNFAIAKVWCSVEDVKMTLEFDGAGNTSIRSGW